MGAMSRIPLIEPLTSTESLVVEMLYQGQSDREIAVQLGVTAETVRSHVCNAARKIPGDLPQRLRIRFWAAGQATTVPRRT